MSLLWPEAPRSAHRLRAMGAFSPVYDGTIEVLALPDDFTELIARRVESGLLVPGSRGRANYVVRSKSHDAVAFSAVGFWTQYAFGLNEVELKRAGPKSVTYHGSFWRWTLYAAINALALAIVILFGILFWPGARAQISSYSWGWLYVGALFAFFGLVWPWLLVAIHRRVVPRTLERIVRETLAT
jgi:hypothetical protein